MKTKKRTCMQPRDSLCVWPHGSFFRCVFLFIFIFFFFYKLVTILNTEFYLSLLVQNAPQDKPVE